MCLYMNELLVFYGLKGSEFDFLFNLISYLISE